MVAIVGLTIAVVILATDSDELGRTSTGKLVKEIRYGGFNPTTGRPDSAALPERGRQGSTPSDGDPEEGTPLGPRP
jgi:hypothetical protein